MSDALVNPRDAQANRNRKSPANGNGNGTENEIRETALAREYLGSHGRDSSLSEEQVVDLLQWLEDRLAARDPYARLLLVGENEADSSFGIEDLDRFLSIWGLSQAEGARIFGVSRQALSKWKDNGIPAARLSAVATLSAASDVLRRHLKPERIPAIVRRPAAAHGGLSLMALATEEGAEAVLAACRAMFDFGRANTPRGATEVLGETAERVS
ncbi:MAG: hypothetical protein K8J08_19210 [Thermoanaerobaculia bacterium]|nr:hypothetical protein [Thermoanaerobaculia bacterium]